MLEYHTHRNKILYRVTPCMKFIDGELYQMHERLEHREHGLERVGTEWLQVQSIASKPQMPQDEEEHTQE